ncbi:MAG: hypothetical protein IT559_05540 [Alphaproteobacteria bacterium]|nr:hypothetical protein [Alphaproteobacteria bacterium]
MMGVFFLPVRQSLFRLSCAFIIIAAFSALLFVPPVHAQESAQAEAAKSESIAETPVEKPIPSKPLNLPYSPEHCEFEVRFPEAPALSSRCDDDSGKRCYDLISYTQVYELSSTVSFRVICNPIDAGINKQYNAEVMKATLKAMTQGKLLQSFNSDFREEKGFKQAGLVGEGLVGRTPTIYIAQLWIGQHSALSVEAELIGEANDEADKLYSDILRTVRYTGDKKVSDEKTNKE